MDFSYIKNQLELQIEYVLLRYKKYWKSNIVELITFNFLFLISNYITGIFIQNVSDIHYYLYLIVMGTIIYFGYSEGVEIVMDFIYRRNSIFTYKTYSSIIFFIFRMIFDSLIYLLLSFILFFVFFLFFSKSFIYLIFLSFIFSIILMIFTLSFYFIFSPIYLLVKREDSRYLRRLINMFLFAFVPVAYSLSFYFFYKYAIIFPPSVLLQEFRNIVLNKPTDYNLLFLSMISSLVYLIIGVILFNISYRKARKEGTLTLQ